MNDCVQIHARIPTSLKRRLVIALAHQELKITDWLKGQLEEWLHDVERPEEHSDRRERAHAPAE